MGTENKAMFSSLRWLSQRSLTQQIPGNRLALVPSPPPHRFVFTGYA